MNPAPPEMSTDFDALALDKPSLPFFSDQLGDRHAPVMRSRSMISMVVVQSYGDELSQAVACGQLTYARAALASSRSAALLTLSCGLDMWGAIARARAAHSGVRICRRSETNESRVVVEKRRDVPTLMRLS